jgi:ornithine--oxo-acid transaminase
MLAVELKPEAGGARRYCERLRELGLLAKDTHEHTIRLAPPLVVKGEEIDWASDVFARGPQGLNPPDPGDFRE